MKTVEMNLTRENHERIKEEAEAQGVFVQEYVQTVLDSLDMETQKKIVQFPVGYSWRRG